MISLTYGILKMIQNKQAHQNGEGEIEFGINRCSPLYIKKRPTYSTRNYTPVINYYGKESEKEYIYN